MVNIHVGFELLAWALVLNLGSVFGRYMKNPPADAYSWYQLHMIAQLVGSLLSVMGFVVIFTHIYAYGASHFEGTHQILGLALIILTMGQPILGFLAHRVFVSTGGTSRYHTLHRWLGRILLPLGFLVMGFGMKLYIEEFISEKDYIRSDFAWLCFTSILLGLVVTCFTFERIMKKMGHSSPDTSDNLSQGTELPVIGEDEVAIEIVPVEAEFTPKELSGFSKGFDMLPLAWKVEIDRYWPIWNRQIVFIMYFGFVLFCIIPLFSALIM